jgi:uncharacterized membrane protein
MKNFFHTLRNLFFSGLAVLLPVILTILLLKFIILSLDEMAISMVPQNLRPDILIGYDIPGIGIVATIFIILVIGALTRFYFGRYLVSLGERIIARIPLGNSIYASIKQLVDSLSTGGKRRLKEVVAIEYPKEGTYAIGFLTGDSIDQIEKINNKKYVNVFVPTSPNPTSGFLLLVPEDKAIKLSITIDDAFKIILSGGFIKR